MDDLCRPLDIFPRNLAEKVSGAEIFFSFCSAATCGEGRPGSLPSRQVVEYSVRHCGAAQPCFFPGKRTSSFKATSQKKMQRIDASRAVQKKKRILLILARFAFSLLFSFLFICSYFEADTERNKETAKPLKLKGNLGCK